MAEQAAENGGVYGGGGGEPAPLPTVSDYLKTELLDPSKAGSEWGVGTGLAGGLSYPHQGSLSISNDVWINSMHCYAFFANLAYFSNCVSFIEKPNLTICVTLSINIPVWNI